MLKFVKYLYITLIPQFLRRKIVHIRIKINNIKLNIDIIRSRKRHKKLISELTEKKIINVVFLVIHHAIWKYEEVYRLLNNDSKFNVKVVIIPLVNDGKEDMKTYNQTLNYFVSSGYSTLSSYNQKNDSWIDIKKTTDPDIVFFTNPHRLTFDKYYINEFKDRLTCYVPYAFVVIHTIEGHYNQNIHHLLWKYFVETKYHRAFAKLYSKKRVNNIVVSGYPSLDVIYRKNFIPKPSWKVINSKTIKIIWAPHHTIEGQGNNLDYSSFFDYSNFFLTLLYNRKDIQIAFKPHPLLREKLYIDSKWGKEKTDNYYSSWNKLSNGQLEDGPYIDLFSHSDAMITDSASFIAEYLYFNKPLCFTMKDNNVKNRFNSFGKMIFDYLYTSNDSLSTEFFINNVIIDKNDYLKESRNRFFKETILTNSGRTASENIYNEIIHELC